MRLLEITTRGALTVLLIAVSAAAQADSAVGISLAAGNQLNPTGLIPGLLTDSRGMSLFIANSRSPTGFLYPQPFVLPELTQDKTSPAWWHTAWVDGGLLLNASNTRVASFSEYGDWSSGFLGSFGMYAENRETAHYVSALAGSIGRDDQFYSLTTGRYGVFRLNLAYAGAPHLLATNAKIPWEGGGTANLTLPPGMVPGATTVAQLQTALARTLPSNLGFSRTTTGMAMSYTPSDTWELFLNAANEWRDGNKPIGSTFFFPGRGFAELVQPVKYRTTDLSAGARFKGEEVQANLTYVGSFFRNDFNALTWDNPGLGAAAGAFVPQRGRIALVPDNDYHTLKADAAWAVSDLQFAANASYSVMRQDDELLPPVVNTGLAPPVNLANWNTIAALSRQTAKAGLETVNGFAQVRWNADQDFTLTLESRYRDENNTTNYAAFNPSTGEFGYLGLDGALSRIYTPAIPGTDVPIRNIPFENDEFKVTSKADYRMGSHTRLGLLLIHDEIDRTYREVLHANDNSAEAQLSSVGHEWGTVRFSYSYADRDGSSYVTDPYLFARSPSLPGYRPRAGGDLPYALATFRKYDVADRREHTAKLQSNFILSENSDFQLTGSFRHSDYDADYGLRALDTYDANASYTNRITNSLTLTTFYGYQFHRRAVASINAARGTNSDDTAGGPNYPLNNAWRERARDANHLFGANLDYKFEKFALDLDYTYSQATSDFAYSFAGVGAISPTLTPLEAGLGFPDQRFDHHIVEATLVWTYSEKIAFRWYYRLEHETLDDFHYAGLTNVVGNNIFLGTIPQDYTAHIFGIITQYRF
jgi:MtrB/PioB family decaheme-associated outer membrane protein